MLYLVVGICCIDTNEKQREILAQSILYGSHCETVRGRRCNIEKRIQLLNGTSETALRVTLYYNIHINIFKITTVT